MTSNQARKAVVSKFKVLFNYTPPERIVDRVVNDREFSEPVTDETIITVIIKQYLRIKGDVDKYKKVESPDNSDTTNLCIRIWNSYIEQRVWACEDVVITFEHFMENIDTKLMNDCARIFFNGHFNIPQPTFESEHIMEFIRLRKEVNKMKLAHDEKTDLIVWLIMESTIDNDTLLRKSKNTKRGWVNARDYISFTQGFNSKIDDMVHEDIPYDADIEE